PNQPSAVLNVHIVRKISAPSVAQQLPRRWSLKARTQRSARMMQLIKREFDRAPKPVRLEVEAGLPVSYKTLLDEDRAEPLALRSSHRRPARLPPREPHLALASVADHPPSHIDVP